ncbi:MalY/PatB family protein [Fodinicola feengrottensis]|uniref:cysteine-S-conjugate beta-lyase n=1 Tax=Fodinicola feengrottensis TaxID=435914 RepID=A0ABP4V0T4_9ACTN|nr:aminotransferase class I/II-fold pyridoxal phosphate-dependent enzyme [Fodinicola feengrottensis]
MELSARTGVKWASCEPDVIAAWLADMDFAAPAVVREALIRYVQDGDLGYPPWLLDDASPLRSAFAERMRVRHDWTVDESYVREFTDLIQGLQAVLQVGTSEGDAVAVLAPAYPPVLASVEDLRRRLVPLADWESLAETVARQRVRALVLVNPHNPSGRCMRVEELAAVAEVAETYDLLVIADEIHADLTFPPARFVPFGSLAPDRTVTLTSATKAFNLAGLRCAVGHVGSASVRAGLARLPPNLLGDVSTPAVLATLAAWRSGDGWLSAVLEVLQRNRDFLVAELGSAGIDCSPPDAGYLAWLDCRALQLPSEPAQFFLEHARVRLSSGLGFGPSGRGFARLNFGTSPDLVAEISSRLVRAVER